MKIETSELVLEISEISELNKFTSFNLIFINLWQAR